MKYDHLRVGNRDLRSCLSAQQEKTILQGIGTTYPQSALYPSVRSVVLQIDYGISFYPATPIIILIVEARDWSKPADFLVKKLNSKLDQHSAARSCLSTTK